MNLHFTPTKGNLNLTPNQENQKKILLNKLEGKKCLLNITEAKAELTRTQLQNNALHLWCTQIAEEYTERGFTLPEVIKNFKMELFWTKDSVKSVLIHTAMSRMFGKTSTKQLLKQGEIEKLVDVMTKFNAPMGVDYIPWPAKCEKCHGIDCICKDIGWK